MAQEWIAPVATAAVGVAGVFFTWLSGWQGRKTAEAIAQGQQDHAAQEAALAREQDRKAEAYVRILEVAEQTGNWVQSVQPLITTDPPQESPPLPELEPQVASRAVLLAFGSAEVRLLWDEWETNARKVLTSNAYLRLLQHEGDSETRRERQRMRLEIHEQLKPAELAARASLADKINSELSPREQSLLNRR